MRSNPDREVFFKLLSAGPGDRVLDIGAGRGVVARRVLASNVGEVHALDPNQKCVAAMQRDSPELKASVAGAERIPYPDSFFSKVYTTMALHHFSDLDRALAEIARVLKPGGSLLILDVDPSHGRGRVMRFIENSLFRRHLTFMRRDQLVEKLTSTGSFDVSESLVGRSGYFVLCVRIAH
jgi:ubiquinone/menaquinone biosynthesis C-methylase UbiE